MTALFGRLTSQTIAILQPMPQRSLRQEILDDLRGPVRDLVIQVFFLLVTLLLEGVKQIVFVTGILAEWLKSTISFVFDTLTLLALAALAIPMAFRMFRSIKRAWR